MAKKLVKIEDAVGKVLCHDITEVNLDKNFKGVAFKKGHIIREEDIQKLKDLGKEYIYVLELSEDEIHEDEAAVFLADALMGENTYRDETPSEGKIRIYSSVYGVTKIEVERIVEFNMVGEPSCPTIHDGMLVREGDVIAAVRIISLVAPKAQVEKAAKIGKGAISVVPLLPKKAGLIITGTEVYTGRVKDRFYERLVPKLRSLLVDISEYVILPDDLSLIKEKLLEFIQKCDLVLLTGGTSVDPDDVTYKAIKEAGAENFIRGNPMQPGNMLTMGWVAQKPVIAVPAAALFFKATALDVWLPYILTGRKITKEMVAKKAHGGLCHRCPVCVFPVCPFGRG